MAAAIRSGSIVRRTGSTSTNTGRAPAIMMASALYAADNGVVITSSPAPMSERAQDQRDRVGAGADADRVRRARRGGEFLLERLDLGSEHEPAALDHAIDRGPDVGAHRRPAPAT